MRAVVSRTGVPPGTDLGSDDTRVSAMRRAAALGEATFTPPVTVFGTDDRRPKSTRFNNAGLDVSPALNGCLGFGSLNGDQDQVDWRFVDDIDVPDGPWRRIVTLQQVVGW